MYRIRRLSLRRNWEELKILYSYLSFGQRNSKQPINGPESFHAHYNEQFYSCHPAIYIFLDTIIKFQTTTYLKLQSIQECAPHSRQDKEKEQFRMQFYE